MFTSLLKRNLPVYFVNCVCNWYSKLSAAVKWNGKISEYFKVNSGVRQGGILSPFLFNIYVNSIITLLCEKDMGCHIGNMYIGCIMYADDLLLLSASVVVLQRMLNVCGDIAGTLGVNLIVVSRIV